MTSYLKQKQRYERIHDFIKRKATGPPSHFARKLNIDDSTLYRHLKFMKEEWDALIIYSKDLESYFYLEEFELPI